MVIFNHLSLLIDQKLGKVPRNLFSLFFCLIVQRRVLAKEIVSWMSVLPIDLYFLCQLKSDTIFRPSKSVYLLGSTSLLSSKLVARDSYDFEAPRFHFCVDLNQLFVVLVCQSSLSCYINNQDGLFIFGPSTHQIFSSSSSGK